MLSCTISEMLSLIYENERGRMALNMLLSVKRRLVLAVTHLHTMFEVPSCTIPQIR